MSFQLRVNPVYHAWQHGGSTRQYHVAEQHLSEIHLAAHDGVDENVSMPSALIPTKLGVNSTSGHLNLSLPMVMT